MKYVTLVSQARQITYRIHADTSVTTSQHGKSGVQQALFGSKKINSYDGYRILVSVSGQFRYYLFQNGWVLKEHVFTQDVELFSTIADAAGLWPKWHAHKDRKWKKEGSNNPLSEGINYVRPFVQARVAMKGQ